MHQADINLVGIPDAVRSNGQNGLAAHFGSLAIDLPGVTECNAGAMRISATLRNGVWTATKVTIFTGASATQRSTGGPRPQAVAPVQAAAPRQPSASVSPINPGGGGFAALSRGKTAPQPQRPAGSDRPASASAPAAQRPAFAAGAPIDDPDIPF